MRRAGVMGKKRQKKTGDGAGALLEAVRTGDFPAMVE